MTRLVESSASVRFCAYINESFRIILPSITISFIMNSFNLLSSDKEHGYHPNTSLWTPRLTSSSFGQPTMTVPYNTSSFFALHEGYFPHHHQQQPQTDSSYSSSSPMSPHTSMISSPVNPYGAAAAAAYSVMTWPPHLHPQASQVYNREISVDLDDPPLWDKFYELGTEMIITKTGRRMFPSLKVRVHGLDSTKRYCVYLTMDPVDDCRYKYQQNRWLAVGKAEPVPPQRYFMHPDSPASGAHWMKQPVSFIRLKLTNNNMDPHGNIIINSMHRYRPRVYVAEVESTAWMPMRIVNYASFEFDKTDFIAVTAYQNQSITQLKIDNNPFAKGFRSTGKRGNKRSHSSHSSDSQLFQPKHILLCG